MSASPPPARRSSSPTATESSPNSCRPGSTPTGIKITPHWREEFVRAGSRQPEIPVASRQYRNLFPGSPSNASWLISRGTVRIGDLRRQLNCASPTFIGDARSSRSGVETASGLQQTARVRGLEPDTRVPTDRHASRECAQPAGTGRYGMTPLVLARALAPFPIPVRTLDGLHL